MALSFDLIVVGDYCADLVFTGLPGMPELGAEIISTGFELIPGGSYNTALSAHRLGLKVGWACDFGNDEFSEFVLRGAQKEGLPDSLFVRHNRPLRNVTVALSYPDERAFVAFYDTAPAVPAGFKALALASTRALYVPGVYFGRLFEAGLVAIRGKKMKLVMDGNSPRTVTLADPQVKKAIRSLDLFTPNASEARRMTGEEDLETALAALGELCPTVVVKDGPSGAMAICEGKTYRVPGIPVKAIDTTGAGDCFNAGFVRAWLDGRTMEECLRWGNIVGGLSTTMHGGTGRVVREKDVREWLKVYDQQG